jgi:hypothetical protein
MGKYARVTVIRAARPLGVALFAASARSLSAE